MDLKICSVSDRYVKFLREDPKLKNVFDNKENTRSHTRKYLGAVIEKNGFNYYIPFSSPKNSDYNINENGLKTIRKSITPIIRMTSTDSLTGKPELKGTLKIGNMIPVPQSELTPYNITDEQDLNYKTIVSKEYAFIKANKLLILRNANNLYNEKTNCDKIFSNGKHRPNYLNSTIDFKYAEEKCTEYCKNQDISKQVSGGDKWIL